MKAQRFLIAPIARRGLLATTTLLSITACQGDFDPTAGGSGPSTPAVGVDSGTGEDLGDTSGRVVSGLEVLYEFGEGLGRTVANSSTTADNLTLSIGDPFAVEWRSSGLLVRSGTTLMANFGPSQLATSCTSSSAITIEAWVTPQSTEQNGPARILTFSVDTNNRNFHLAQENDSWDLRLRTSETDDNGAALRTGPATLLPLPTHVVFTRDALGNANVYLNGQLRQSELLPGSFANWAPSYQLALANELTQNRPWLGEYHLVAVYCRALDPTEVTQNYNARY